MPRPNLQLPRLPRKPTVPKPPPAPLAPASFGREPRATSAPRPWATPPGSWPGSAAEWAIYWAHGVLGRGSEARDTWQYQGTPRGLPYSVDFAEHDRAIAIGINDKGISRDAASLTAILLLGLEPPWRYVIIDRDDAMSRPVQVLADALDGIGHSTLGELP